MVGQFIPHLLTKPSATVVTVSSAVGFVPLPITSTYNATKAAVHLFTESMRVQLADTSIQRIDLIPPGVRTTLMGQENSESSLPLDDYVAETLALLKADNNATEIVVEAAKPLRHAEMNGEYRNVLKMLS